MTAMKAPLTTPTTSAKILVVDDEPAIVDAVATALRYEGFEVEEATNGRDALSTALSFEPALIVLDWMLPDIDGLEVGKRLRERGFKTAILFLTARGGVENTVEALRAGGDEADSGEGDHPEEQPRAQRELPDHGLARLGVEHVPGLPHGADQRRPGRVELAAQVAHVGLDDVRVAAEVVAPHLLEDLALREDAARVEQEEPQQVELGRHQLDARVRAKDLVAPLVENEIAVAEDVAGQVTGRPPEDRLDAGDDLGEAERLGHVVVAAGAKRLDLVLDPSLCGQEEDRGLEAAVTKPAAVILRRFTGWDATFSAASQAAVTR